MSKMVCLAAGAAVLIGLGGCAMNSGSDSKAAAAAPAPAVETIGGLQVVPVNPPATGGASKVFLAPPVQDKPPH